MPPPLSPWKNHWLPITHVFFQGNSGEVTGLEMLRTSGSWPSSRYYKKYLAVTWRWHLQLGSCDSWWREQVGTCYAVVIFQYVNWVAILEEKTIKGHFYLYMLMHRRLEDAFTCWHEDPETPGWHGRNCLVDFSRIPSLPNVKKRATWLNYHQLFLFSINFWVLRLLTICQTSAFGLPLSIVIQTPSSWSSQDMQRGWIYTVTWYHRYHIII